jgi:hypothetical protein
MTERRLEVSEILRRSGWRPSRRVEIVGWCDWLGQFDFEVHDSFREFISEFGGLAIEERGEGEVRAREPIEFDPDSARGEEDRFQGWNRIVGKTILPIGELDQGRYFLGIDEDGAIYVMVDWLGRFGIGIEGLENLILGGPIEEVYDHFPIQGLP